jgi:hypothetical protein
MSRRLSGMADLFPDLEMSGPIEPGPNADAVARDPGGGGASDSVGFSSGVRALVPMNGAAEPPPVEVIPAAEDMRDHKGDLRAGATESCTRRPPGYDRALQLVRDAELTISDGERAGERALVAHDHALLVAIRMGRRAGRSLTLIASDTGTSASHLSRLQGCRRLTLLYARTPDMSPEQRQERYSISCIRHLLGKDPAIQRRGMHMLAVGPCSERAMRDFVRVERAADGSQPNLQPTDLPKIARDAIARGQVITVKTSADDDPERVLVTIRVILPRSAGEPLQALPRGNGTRHRSRAA